MDMTKIRNINSQRLNTFLKTVSGIDKYLLG